MKNRSDVKRGILQQLSSKAKSGKVYETLVDIFKKHVVDTGDKTAFIFLQNGSDEKESITYRELDQKAAAIAAELLQKHQPGEGCLLLLPEGIDFIAGFMGCLYAGLIAIPAHALRRNRNNNRFFTLLENSEAKAVLTNKTTSADLKRHFGENQQIQKLDHTIIENVDPVKAKQWTMPDMEPSDIAFLQYTSGSTGKPNGTMVSHANLVANLEIIKQSFGHDENLVGVNWLPPFHDMGLIGALLQPLYTGGMNVIIPPNTFLRDPGCWLKAITKYKGSTAGGPNFALDYCVEKISEEEKKEIDLSSVKIFFCGAEPISIQSLDAFSDRFKENGFEARMFYPCYGLAEATLMVTGGDRKEDPFTLSQNMETGHRAVITDKAEQAKQLVACGYPWLGTRLLIVDPGSREICRDMQIGEIWVEGPSVCKGYWNNAQGTKHTFEAYTAESEGPFMRSGDLGFIHEGQLYITGRLKDLIIIRGQNHYPHDIEKTVENAHEALRKYSGAAFSIDLKEEERPVILQEVERTFLRDLNKEEVFDAIRSALATEHDLQAHAIVLLRTGSIPKTSSGKIRRQASKKAYLNDELNVVASWEQQSKQDTAPASIRADELSPKQIESWLSGWLAAKTGMDPRQIDPEKSVLSYGLDSIGAVELEREVNKQFGISIELSDFLENNSIKELARKGFEMMR
ncbi:MAG: AMP-binding protein [Bacteroidales bacterium]|nr:AMP-binding protein [Bacteroidales bacterium]MCF8350316.1 AMP-binding protein [Bacteroidales bacterium]MCF8375980.1 AMP-binding protein [Bacteroidales bacterium]MCF8400468.1 AMP-binding protein [Bacteroidales bacterium]